MRSAVRAFYETRKENKAEIEARMRHYANLAQAMREMHERFPVIDGTNAEQALKFQAERIVELGHPKGFLEPLMHTCKTCGPECQCSLEGAKKPKGAK